MLTYCRLCLNNDRPMINVLTSELKYSNLDIIEFLYWMFDVEVDINDLYSKLICQRCVEIIRKIGHYRDVFKKSQLILQEKSDELGSICTKEIEEWTFCDTFFGNENRRNKSLPSETLCNNSFPVISITKLENSSILGRYDKIGDLLYKKKITVTKDTGTTETRNVSTSTDLIHNYQTVKVPVEVFRTCMCPSLSICKLENTTICEEYTKVDNTTYREIPNKFDLNPDLMRLEVKRMRLIEHYYNAPTTALQELIKEKQCAIEAGKIKNVPPPPNISEPLIQVHDVLPVEVCSYCSKSFKTKKLLFKHCKSQHRKLFRKEILNDIKQRKKYKKRLTQTKISKQDSVTVHKNSQQPTQLLSGIRSKWNNISNLIHKNKERNIFETDYNNFPNLKFIKDQANEKTIQILQQKEERSKGTNENSFETTRNKTNINIRSIQIICSSQPHPLQLLETSKNVISETEHQVQKDKSQEKTENNNSTNTEVQSSENDVQQNVELKNNAEQIETEMAADKVNSVTKEIKHFVYPSAPQTLQSLQTKRNMISKLKQCVQTDKSNQKPKNNNFSNSEESSGNEILSPEQQSKSNKNMEQSLNKITTGNINLEMKAKKHVVGVYPSRKDNVRSLLTKRKAINSIKQCLQKVGSKSRYKLKNLIESNDFVIKASIDLTKIDDEKTNGPFDLTKETDNNENPNNLLEHIDEADCTPVYRKEHHIQKEFANGLLKIAPDVNLHTGLPSDNTEKKNEENITAASDLIDLLKVNDKCDTSKYNLSNLHLIKEQTNEKVQIAQQKKEEICTGTNKSLNEVTSGKTNDNIKSIQIRRSSQPLHLGLQTSKENDKLGEKHYNKNSTEGHSNIQLNIDSEHTIEQNETEVVTDKVNSEIKGNKHIYPSVPQSLQTLQSKRNIISKLQQLVQNDKPNQKPANNSLSNSKESSGKEILCPEQNKSNKNIEQTLDTMAEGNINLETKDKKQIVIGYPSRTQNAQSLLTNNKAIGSIQQCLQKVASKSKNKSKSLVQSNDFVINTSVDLNKLDDEIPSCLTKAIKVSCEDNDKINNLPEPRPEHPDKTKCTTTRRKVYHIQKILPNGCLERLAPDINLHKSLPPYYSTDKQNVKNITAASASNNSSQINDKCEKSTTILSVNRTRFNIRQNNENDLEKFDKSALSVLVSLPESNKTDETSKPSAINDTSMLAKIDAPHEQEKNGPTNVFDKNKKRMEGNLDNLQDQKRKKFCVAETNNIKVRSKTPRWTEKYSVLPNKTKTPDKKLNEVLTQRGTCGKLKSIAKHMQKPDIGLTARSCKPRKINSRKKSHTPVKPNLEDSIQELSGLMELIYVGNKEQAINTTAVNDHICTIENCHTIDNIRQTGTRGKMHWYNLNYEKLTSNSTKSSTIRSGHVKEMEKLCKPCTVMVDKLDLEKQIPGLLFTYIPEQNGEDNKLL